MQKYKEINGNDYVKNSRTTINETMQSIQSMNSGTAFPTNNLFEGMKCYRTDLKKTYTLTDVENNTWVEDAHATLSDEATHAASATKLQTARSLNLGGAVTADAATFDGTADATINVKTLDATKLKGTAPVNTTGNAASATKLATPRTLSLTGKAAGFTSFDGSSNADINVTSVNADTASKLSTARKINIVGNATGSTTFDGSGDVSISTTVNESKHAATADTLKSSAATETSTVTRPVWLSWEGDNTKQVVSPNLTYTCGTKTLTAANFKGHLVGNADTATKIVNNGNRNNLANGTKPPSGLSVYQCYRHAGYPQQYGNVVSIGGTGDNELFLGWQDDARLLFRAKRDTWESWTDWRAIAFTDEINNYAPTKTGGGASGTWGINISGNATNANSARLISPFEIATAYAFRNVWFSDSDVNNKACYSPNIQYNPASNVLKVGTVQGNITGNADTVDGYHASDIIDRITAANTGGIVAASLTENGYVKFANGLILQWGYGNGNSDTTFPISFKSFVRVVCTCDNVNWAWARDITTTGFSLRAGGGACWLAVGM